MLSKVMHLFTRGIGCCKRFPGDVRDFGFGVAGKLFWDELIPVGKSKGYIETLSRFVNKEMEPLTRQYAQGQIPEPQPRKALDHIPVWMCWWQGEAQMPPIIKACVNRIKSSLPPTARLQIITLDNYPEFVELPEDIVEKYQQGIIGNAHFADILRYALVGNYGGGWIDATVLLSPRIVKKIPQYLENFYYTQRFSSWDACPQEACRGKWCNFFFMGQAECPLFHYVYEGLLLWWRKFDRPVDYVFLDYILWSGYCGVEAIREAVDDVPAGNENIWYLAGYLNEPYTPELWNELMGKNELFKLSYKGDMRLTTDKGEKTIYAHILEDNGVG